MPKAAHIKNAFDFRLINAKRGCADGGHLSLGCLLYVRLADESCNAQEKISCLICESHARIPQDRTCGTKSLTFALRCDIARTVAVASHAIGNRRRRRSSRADEVIE
jgi:hypothetical protein